MAPKTRDLLSFLLVVGTTLLPSTQSAPLIPGLIDPDAQPKFRTECPNALDPDFEFDSSTGYLEVGVRESVAFTGLVDDSGNALPTPIWGYGQDDDIGYTWPGRTIEARAYETLQVRWKNELGPGYLLTGLNGRSVIDTSIHWCYSLRGYQQYSIEVDGPPLVMHLHGGNTESASDGNPEDFFSHDYKITGPLWVKEVYSYHNTQPAATLWFHDHALGITSQNVYAGLAGFYIVRDEIDTGKPDNPLNLPAFPYEAAFVIQDRFFKDNGELFYPAFQGDPFYDDYITNENVTFPRNRPTRFAELLADVMTVNGKIWPKFNVEARKYRLRLLNGCDSRYLILNFYVVPAGTTDLTNVNKIPLPFTIIGGDAGFSSEPIVKDSVLVEPSTRFDIIFDFAGLEGYRIIMANLGGDEPFGGDAGAQIYNGTDRVMAFDVKRPRETSAYKQNFQPDDFDDSVINFVTDYGTTSRVRRLALFEGRDQYNRLQPLLGTVDPATDKDGNPIFWPNSEPYQRVGLAGAQMEGSLPWHAPTTENVELDSTEEWEIWNITPDTHPIHIHLVDFVVVSRRDLILDSNSFEAEIPDGEVAAGDGTYLVQQPLVQHDGSVGVGYRVVNPTVGGVSDDLSALYDLTEFFPRDVVAALPGQVTRLKMRFNRPGGYVWHCHILSHEDHEMMRVFTVGGQPYHMDHFAMSGSDPIMQDNTNVVSSQEGGNDNNGGNVNNGGNDNSGGNGNTGGYGNNGGRPDDSGFNNNGAGHDNNGGNENNGGRPDDGGYDNNGAGNYNRPVHNQDGYDDDNYGPVDSQDGYDDDGYEIDFGDDYYAEGRRTFFFWDSHGRGRRHGPPHGRRNLRKAETSQ